MAWIAEDSGRRVRPEKVPPHSLEAAEPVLGSMMLSREAIAAVAEVVEAVDFCRRPEKEEVVAVRALVDQAMVDLENIQQRDSAYAGTPTGFRDVDTLLSGLQRGNLIVVAARPGVGKSSFVTNLARNVAVDSRVGVAMFSLEMSRRAIGMRRLCGDARVRWLRVG